tara:strand:- start:905 stop:1414 length:510 start_codon:yes stop_codon:yes gene_type:complete
MIEFITVALTLMASQHTMPIYFDAEQKAIGDQIIKQAHRLGEDPYPLMAIAWQESRIKRGKTSHTGDVGIFQINWRFWGKKVWKYKSYQQFVEDMDNVEHGTLAAVMVLREMRLYKTCVGINLYACYNGGPAWMKSKNIDKIATYARRVHAKRQQFSRRHKSWMKRKKE